MQILLAIESRIGGKNNLSTGQIYSFFFSQDRFLLILTGLPCGDSLDILESAEGGSASCLGLVGGHHAARAAALHPVVVGEGGQRALGPLLRGHHRLRWKCQRVDEDAEGGEEDVGGVERVVRGKSLVLEGLEDEGEGGRGRWR